MHQKIELNSQDNSKTPSCSAFDWKLDAKCFENFLGLCGLTLQNGPEMLKIKVLEPFRQIVELSELIFECDISPGPAAQVFANTSRNAILYRWSLLTGIK